MRVIVTGSRETTPGQARFVKETLDRVLGTIAREGGEITLIEGECHTGGVDRDAREWAEATAGVEPEGYPADWGQHGRGAGPIRNGEMVATGAQLCIGFPAPDSRGTWDCLKQAARAGIPGRIYPLPDPEVS